MEVIKIAETILYFILYSFAGWACVTVYYSLWKKHFINKGFLKGPCLPVYGIGAILIITASDPVRDYPAAVFFICICLAAVVEYIAGWLMESLFQVRWWDYSRVKYHLHGRICLKNTVLYGILGMTAVYILHPAVLRLIGQIPQENYRTAVSVIIALLFLDLIHSLSELLKLTDRMKLIRECLLELDHYAAASPWYQKKHLHGNILKLKEMCEKNPSDQNLKDELVKLDKTQKKLEELSKLQARERLVRAFPGLKIKELDSLLDFWKNYWEQYQKATAPARGKLLLSCRNLAGKIKDFFQYLHRIFLSRLKFNRLFWVFVIGGVLGFVTETIYCFFLRGQIESRQGLLYGPFSQIYGFGAVFMIIILEPFARKNDRWLFIGGAMVGGAFEYISSLFQEIAFGTVSWNYSDQTFSIGGRTSLTYMFFWGILSIVFMKSIYPKLSNLIERIPNRQGRFFSNLLMIVLVIDLFLTVSALYRWSDRIDNPQPANAYEVFLDDHYTDERLEKIYPNMRQLEK